MKYTLTDKFCREVPHPETGQRIYFDAHKDAPRGFGLRVTKAAKSWTLSYLDPARRQRRLTLPNGYPDWGPKAAREDATKLRVAINAGADPLAERAVERKAIEARRTDSESMRAQTLGALLLAYADHLQAAGKPSHREVRRAVERNIIEPRDSKGRPDKELAKIAAMRADAITIDDAMPAFRRLTKAGKLREAEKLRSYLRAAFTVAKRARHDASLHAFSGFRIAHNPLADLEVTRPKEAAERAAKSAAERKWSLSEDELRSYWRRIGSLPDPDRALLRFHLLTGGQRGEQLSRLSKDNYDHERRTVTLFDTKGRRKSAHEHVVPLIPDALAALQAMRGSRGEWLFTVNGGAAPAGYHGLQHRVRAVGRAMVAAGESARPCTPGTIRKTVESRLQQAGVSREVRGYLLSHGLGGVQARHYETHEFDAEKRAALEVLHVIMTGEPATVTLIARKRKAAK